MTYLTAAEFARRIGVQPETVRRWVRARKLKPAGRTPGGQLRFSEDQVREALDQGTMTPRAQDLEAHISASRRRSGWARSLSPCPK